jgi:acetyl-CoA carboxylase carboxyltransferase component
MSGGSHSVPPYFVSWPTGEFGAINPEGSVQITRKRELDAVEDASQRAVLLRKFTDQIYENGRALRMASGAKIDEVIDPADTRLWISTGVRAARTTRDTHHDGPLDTW